MKASTKTLQELFTKKRNGEKERKRALYNLRMPKLHEIFTTVAIVFRRYERLAVLQNVFAITQEKNNGFSFLVKQYP